METNGEQAPKGEQEQAAAICQMMFDTSRHMLDNNGEKGGSFKNELRATITKETLPYRVAVHAYRNISMTREVRLGEDLDPLNVTLVTRRKPRKSDHVDILIEDYPEMLELNKSGGTRFRVDEESGELEEIGEADLSTANYYRRVLNAFPDE
jgi:hypothetical protein